MVKFVSSCVVSGERRRPSFSKVFTMPMCGVLYHIIISNSEGRDSSVGLLVILLLQEV